MYTCPAYGSDLFFDNLFCTCGCEVGFDPRAERFVADVPTCANRDEIQCNWLAGDGTDLCASCAKTTVHPDLAVLASDQLWANAERAKRRVLTGLRRWGWFGSEDIGRRPDFHRLSEATAAGPAEVTMGRLVTIKLAESDVAERVRRREELGEPYRTLVGHFRHGIAQFLFERLSVSEEFQGTGLFGLEL